MQRVNIRSKIEEEEKEKLQKLQQEWVKFIYNCVSFSQNENILKLKHLIIQVILNVLCSFLVF